MCIEPENEAVKQSIDEVAFLKRELAELEKDYAQAAMALGSATQEIFDLRQQLADANEARHFNASQCIKMHEEITMLRGKTN